MRKDDEKVESIISDFLDRYFYGPISREKNIRFERVRDRAKQVRGIDVILGHTTIDEKVKYHDGCINRILKYPSFELSFIDRSNRLHDGWFLTGENRYYAFITIYTNGKDHVLSLDDISCLQVLFVSKKDILDLLEKDGIEYMSDGVEIRQHDHDSEFDPDGRLRIYYQNGYRLVWSKTLPESPVNLVIPRRKLETLPHSKDVMIYRGLREIGDNVVFCGRYKTISH